MATPEPTVRITSYAVSCLPEDHADAFHFTIKVEYRGHDRWTVTKSTRYLGADGKWSYGYSWRDGTQEPQSDEDFREVREGRDAWLAAHRFDLETALDLAKQNAPLVKVNGWTAAALLAEEARA